MINRKFILFIILSLLCGSLFGQDIDVDYNTLKFKGISLEHGLSQSSVLCILQDNKGFLWFGTRDGLNKFDGNNFKTYRHDSQDSTSLSNSYIKSLYLDTHGVLWVGTGNGLNKYLPEKDDFQRFVHQGTKSAHKDEIWSISAADHDHLWVGTNFGLGKFDVIHSEYKYYTHIQGDSITISNELIRAIVRTENGNLWIKTIEDVNFFDIKTETFTHYSYPEDASVEENINSKSALYEDSKNNLWMGFGNGLTLYNKDLDRFEFFHLPSEKEHAISDAVRSISEDHYDNLWVGTYRGLYIIDPQRNSISHFVHDENNPNSLSQNSIYSIYQDFKGDFWIGTYAGGVNYYDRSYDLFKHFSSGTNNSKLNYKVVSSIIQDPNDNLWIGTEGGGINFYNKKTGKFTYYMHQSDDPNSLSANNIKAMLRSHTGNFWIGTHDGGLNFLNPKIHPYSFKKYKNIPGDSTSLSDNRVISLFEDHQNRIWIGTSGGGINMFDHSTGKFVRIKDSTEAVGRIVFTISEGRSEDILLIGGDKGLAELNIRTKKLMPIWFKGRDSSLVDSRGVLCTFLDKNKNLWIGTEGDGLYCYYPISGKSVRYGVSQGLPNDVIYGIVPENPNNIWLSTNHGLSRLNLQTRQFKNFDASDGLQGNEFNYGAYLKNSYGELLFGGGNGFNHFNPSKINTNTYIPPVSITSFRVNNQPFLNLIDSDIKVVLKHDQNVLDFDFVALSYSQPNKNQYAYKLEGFDKNWNYVGNRKSATYTNLDAGNYIFRVNASNNDGLWNEEGAVLRITILPALWRTWWAYLAYSFLLIGSLLLIRKYTLQRIHDRNELKHERLEKKRIEEVNKMKLQLFTNISHDFRTPLTLIIGPLERMLKMKAGDGFVQKQHQTIYRNASALMELINQLLDFRKSESGKLQLQASENNIVSFVKDIKLAFDELANSKDIDFTISSSAKEIRVWFDNIMLKKVLFNLLSNAFKFTPDHGQIQLEIKVDESPKKDMPSGRVKIKVNDSGKGIPKENIRFIFERFYQFGERFGTGIGLSLAKNIVELHAGAIKVKSNEKRGTCFTILLPLGNSHLNKEQILENDSLDKNDFYSFEEAQYLVKGDQSHEIENHKEEATDETLPSILIVEDNAEVRTFIKFIFQKNYNIFEAENGASAIETAKSKAIDLIISDVMMPLMDGMELCHEIKSDIITSHIPVILLTARTSEEYQKSGYRIGADAYITKPFDSVILEIRVNNLLKSRKSLIDKFKKDLILQPKTITATSTDEIFLQRAIDIVEENMTNPEFTVNDFIDGMHMSRSALYRKLKSLTDQSITEFIKIIKLKRAAQLMLNTPMSISEIAFDLGFNDLKHFRQSFKQQFHKVPSKYRTEHSADTL